MNGFSQAERELIDAARVARLATADTGGRPHLVPVCFVLDGGCLYSVIDNKPKASVRGLKRLRNIAANPEVALLIDHYHEDWLRLAYLLVQGRAALVESAGEYSAALDALRFKYPQYHGQELSAAANPLLRIAPTAKHYWTAVPATRP